MTSQLQPGFDPVDNNIVVTASIGYASGVSTIVLQAGDGALLPVPTTEGAFYLAYYNASAYNSPYEDPDYEYVRVTNVSTDTITLDSPTVNNHNTVANTYNLILVTTAEYLRSLYNMQNGGMARQSVLNSNFNVWNNGVSFVNPVTGTFTSDKWKVSYSVAGGANPSLTHARQAITPGDLPCSFYDYKLTTDGAGSSYGATAYHRKAQTIVNGTRFLAGNGKKVTVSFYAKSNIAGKKIGVCLVQNYGTGGSPTTEAVINGENITLTSSWQLFTHTFTLQTLVGKTFGTNNDDFINLLIWDMWGASFATYVGDSGAEDFVGAGDIEVAQVQMCAGDIALEYGQKSLAQDVLEINGDDSLFTSTQKTDLTDAGDSTLHYHATDRARANHTGTQSDSTIIESGTAGEILAAGDWVYEKISDGKLYKGDQDISSDDDSWNLVGVIKTGGAADATVYYQNMFGTYVTTGLTAGSTYYLGASGAITATRPVTDDADVIPYIIGVARSTTKLVIKPQRIPRLKTIDTGSVSGNQTYTLGFECRRIEFYNAMGSWYSNDSVTFYLPSTAIFDVENGAQWYQGVGTAVSGSVLEYGRLSATAYFTAAATIDGNLDLVLTQTDHGAGGSGNYDAIITCYEAL